MKFYQVREIKPVIRPFHFSQQHDFGDSPNFQIPDDGIDLEIGAGCGEHALLHASRAGVSTIVAIERTKSRFGKFEKSYIAAGKPSNLLPIRANAVDWISHFLPEGVVRNCFILYPNPYPKRKQQNLRWAQMPFMERLIQALQVNGRLEMRSNIPQYIEEAEVFMTQYWGLRLMQKETIYGEPETLFEKKYLERGDHCQKIVFQKTVLN